MAAARPPKAAGAAREPSAASLRKLARTHTDAALQALADVAATGISEASRISAANALLDRGYGKSGAASTDSLGGTPVLYQRIELIDGSKGGADGQD